KYRKVATITTIIGIVLFVASRFLPIDMIKNLWTSEHAHVYGAIYGGTNWISTDLIGEHLLNYIELICFDYNIQLSSKPVMSFYTVVYIFKIIVVIVGYIVMIHIITKSITGQSKNYHYDCIDEIFAWSYLLLSLVFIFTEFGAMPFARYFTAFPSIMAIVLCRNMNVLMDVLHVEILKQVGGKRFLFCICTMAVCVCGAGKVWTYRAPNTYEDDLKAIAGYLENGDYGYAVAPYWIYSKVSAMSEGKVLVCRSVEEVKEVFGNEAKVTYIITHNDSSWDSNRFTIFENCESYEDICENYSEPTDIIRYEYLEVLVFKDGIKASASK
ncbi:MAG TPA: hypothetical protein DCW90_17660, partial [Lachnospiraceae bacterium]|nr:hypothetical protein [Lachnospiraceae bacterium]